MQSTFSYGVVTSVFRYLKHASANLFTSRQLLYLLVRRDFRARTAGSLMGVSWLFLQPALQVFAFWFLIEFVLQVRFPGRVEFVSYFLVSMVAWLMISEALGRSVTVMSDMAAVYQRSPFPLSLLPLMPVVTAGLVYGAVFLIVVTVFGTVRSALLAPLVIVGLLIWLLPVAYLLSVLGLFVRDIRLATPFVLTMLMFLTPILYSPSMLPDSASWLLIVNPLADLLAIVHFVVFDTPLTVGNVIRPTIVWVVLVVPVWVLFCRACPHVREAL